MGHPGSERATWNWLQKQSALGELIDVDYPVDVAHESLPRFGCADEAPGGDRSALVRHRSHPLWSGRDDHALRPDQHLFRRRSPEQSQGQARPFQEKRSDCPLVTLGLVLDGSGFVRRSQTFEGNVSEAGTLAGMLTGLDAPAGALVIMDAGIATEANVAWLVEHGYRYLVVRRGGTRQFDETQAVTIETADEQPLRLQKVLSEDGQELQLYCHSPSRQLKEEAMLEAFSQRFEAGLQQILDGLAKPRAEKRPDKLRERIGRLKQKSRGASQHYTVDLVTDESGKRVTGITWQKVPREGSQATHPGVYCLRTNQLDWDEERLWRTYTLLTDLESVFPQSQERAGFAAGLSSQGRSRRRPSVHYRAGLPVRAVPSPKAEGGGHSRQLDDATRDPLDPAPGDDDFPPARWPYATCAQGHQRRARADGDLSRLGRQPRTRRNQKTDFLTRHYALVVPLEIHLHCK
jgi:hypothetical protein